MITPAHSLRQQQRCSRGRATRGMTLIEVLLSLTLFGLIMAAMTTQLIESIQLSLKTARNLEFARNSRFVIDRIAQDMGETQVVDIYPSFTDRASTMSDGESGNYVVLHMVSSAGVITRTVGYYLATDASGTAWTLYRHDSADGVIAAGSLPATSTSGTHRRIVRTVRLATGTKLFTNFRDRGFSFRGEFGAADGAPTGRLEFIQCSLTTRS